MRWREKVDKKKQLLFEDESYTLLGKGVEFKGKAKFNGTVRIDGYFEGELLIQDTLIIGEHAVIKGTIVGAVILCGGKIEGTITASQKVQLLKPAVLLGDVHSPSLSMEEGVLFHGMSDMGITDLDGLPSQAGDLENVHDLSVRRDQKLKSQES